MKNFIQTCVYKDFFQLSLSTCKNLKRKSKLLYSHIYIYMNFPITLTRGIDYKNVCKMSYILHKAIQKKKQTESLTK